MAARRLLLLRHAKSSWAEENLADHDRPLAPRGRAAAEWLGREMASLDLIPDLILCSTAQRAAETLAGVLRGLPRGRKVHPLRALYDNSEGDYRGIIAEKGEDATRLLVIGHNPAISTTFELLAASGDRAVIRELKDKFPTAGLAVLEFDIEGWPALLSATGRVTRFVDPRARDG